MLIIEIDKPFQASFISIPQASFMFSSGIEMEYLTDGNELTVLVKSTLFKLEMRNKYWYTGPQLRGAGGMGGGRKSKKVSRFRKKRP